MLPKRFDLDYCRDVLLRRKWQIVVAFVLTLIAALVYLVIAPRMYKATTLILLQQQKVPESYIRSTVTASLEERINTIRQQLTNRTNLEGLLAKFDLYPEDSDKAEASLEEKVEIMQKNIEIQVTRGTTFSISFTYKNPEKAMDVTNALASNFIAESLQFREDRSIGTTQFLANEIANLETSLREKESALTAYKQQHGEALPDQQPTNLSLLGQLRQRMQSVDQSLSDARARKIMLQEQATRLTDMRSFTSLRDPTGLTPEGRTPRASDLSALREELKSLSARYTANHPDVLRLKRRIAGIEAGLQQQAASTGDTPQSGGNRVEPTPETQRENLQADIDAEIRQLESQKAPLEREIARLTRIVTEVPRRQMELAALERGYGTLKAQYDSLNAKKLDSQLAANLEKRQKGEQFNILDVAKMPQKPVRPRVLPILFGAVCLGLAAGFGLALGLEYVDASFRDYGELRDSLQMPVLAVIPHLKTEAKTIKKLRDRLISYVVGGCLLAAMGITVLLWLNSNLHELLQKISLS